MSKKTLYEVLQVHQNASPEAIDAAYQDLKAQCQARYDTGDQNASNELFILKSAFETLSNPAKREYYDETLARMQFQQPQPVQMARPDGSVAESAKLDSDAGTAFERESALPPPESPSGHIVITDIEPPASGHHRLIDCPVCGKPMSRTAPACPHCGEANVEISVPGRDVSMPLGLIGSAVLFIGVFMPIVSMPLVGSINYFRNGQGDGVIILILAAISFFLTLTRNYQKLWHTGVGSVLVLGFTFINFQMKMHDIKKNMDESLAGNPFRGLADAAVESIQLQWGWAMLVLGSALIIAAAAMRKKMD